MVVVVVIVLVWGCIWGFFFGFIALIVALTKPDLRGVHYTLRDTHLSHIASDSYGNGNSKNTAISVDGWKCKKCGRVNCTYVGTCACGNTKQKNNEYSGKVAPDNKPLLNYSADEIRKYKSLLDDGIISQEEFEKKKKELLR